MERKPNSLLLLKGASLLLGLTCVDDKHFFLIQLSKIRKHHRQALH